MAFDFKRAWPALYKPGREPHLVTVPRAQMIAVQGEGDPNERDGAYQQAVSALYAVAYALKTSERAGHRMEGFFDYVVPPLEGIWQQKGTETIDYARKADFQWVSMLRVPDFVREEDVLWACDAVKRKKKLDCPAVMLRVMDEGMCVQCMHIGPYEREPETIAAMDAFICAQGYVNDINEERGHHEIYISGVRTPPERRKTVIRHPVRRG